MLDAGLARVASIMLRDLGVDVAAIPGGGAAGGLGAGLRAFAAAEIVSGSSWVLEQLDFDRMLSDAQLVITGEGAFDAQSSMGKITGEVIVRAAASGVPVLLVTGRVEGVLPKHVHALGDTGERTSGRGGERARASGALRAQLQLDDIERVVREALPRLLGH
jgi:glycerate kinase